MNVSEPFRFLGMNIRGTPRMPRDHVKDDLETGLTRSAVLVMQEFKWRYYWVALRKVVRRLAGKRGTSPKIGTALLDPVRGAQPIVWRRDVFARVRVRVRLLHRARRGFSEDRFLRRVLLRHRKTGLRCWFWTAHLTVGGDRRGDPVERVRRLAADLATLDEFLAAIPPAWPSVGELDANIAQGSGAYLKFMRILKKHGYVVHGGHGVEYCVVRQGTRAQVAVLDDWIIRERDLFTDHEGRGLTLQLIEGDI